MGQSIPSFSSDEVEDHGVEETVCTVRALHPSFPLASVVASAELALGVVESP